MHAARLHRADASSRRTESWAVGVLLLAVAIAYANAFAGSFQFDDFNVIVREASVQSVSAWWRSQPGIRPLLKLSYALNHTWGAGLVGFHAVNVVVHAANTLLVRWLGRLLAPATGLGGPESRRLVFIVAVVFALHPVQTEAVTYVSGRSTALAATFALSSITLWLHGRRHGDRHAVQVASPLALALALACKEYAAVVPLALLVVERLRHDGPVDWRAVGRDLRAHLAVVGLALLAAAAVPRYRHLFEASLAARDGNAQLWTQAQGLTWLAGQLLRFDALNADPALPVVETPDLRAVSLALLWIALLAGALCLCGRQRVAAFAVLWFLLWLAPTQSLLPRLDVANDRQLYVALIGPAFGLAVLLLRWLSRETMALVIPALVLVLGIATAQRNRVYAEEVSYWSDVAWKSPHNARAFANLGHALALEGRLAQAEVALDVALALDPRLHEAAIKRQLLRAGAWP